MHLGVVIPGTVDPTSYAMVVLVGVGQIVTWLVMLRSGRQGEIKRAADAAAAKTAEASGINELAEANKRIAGALERLDQWARTHSEGDLVFQTRTEEILRQQAATGHDMARMLEGLQRQITNVAVGIAPTEAMQLPANRGRRGGG